MLHEWGHALGLHHEHQSPAGGCDTEYDWPKLYAYYLNNYGWQSDRVDKNLRQLIADHAAFDWSTLDRGSIMIYASNPNFLIKHEQSPCYFGENNSLSKLDVEGIQRTYPRQQADLAGICARRSNDKAR